MLQRMTNVFPGPRWDSVAGVRTGTGEERERGKGKVLCSCFLVGLVRHTVPITRGGPEKEGKEPPLVNPGDGVLQTVFLGVWI